jgi:hypothetical protein
MIGAQLEPETVMMGILHDHVVVDGGPQAPHDGAAANALSMVSEPTNQSSHCFTPESVPRNRRRG